MSEPKDVLSLITGGEQTPRTGTFTMGSVTYDATEAYQPPVTIQRRGLPRQAEPPVFNTGHDPHLVNFPRYPDGSVIQMPGLPVAERRTITVPEPEE